MDAGDGIRLKARDARDLEVLAACLQDAVVRLADMTWLPKEKRFVLVATRFRWETEPEAPPPPEPGEDASFAQAARLYSRVNCGLAFDRVTAVRTRNIDAARRQQLLNLLTLRPEGAAIRLIFSGGAEVWLETNGIAAILEDLGQSWPTQWRPSHALDEPSQAG
jgi:hypothetical protein